MHILSLLTGVVPTAFAQTLKNAGKGGAGVSSMWDEICAVLPCDVKGGGLVGYLATRVISFVWPLIASFAVIMIVYAGFKIVTSAGKEDGMSQAKTIIIQAVIGVILAVLATAILTFFGTLFRTILS